MPQEQIDKCIEDHKQKSVFEVFKENWESVVFFTRIQTQWVVGGFGGFIGLNYQSLDFLFKLYKVKNRKQVLEDLQIMEIEALKILNKKADK
jgi:hypothetical protein